MIQLPNNEKCYNLPEQVAQNLLNIKYLAEQYANIDSLPVAWKAYKDQFDEDFDTFGDWTTTFEGWDTTLSTYLANMSSAAVGAIAGQNIAPAKVNATGEVTGDTVEANNPNWSGEIADFTSSWKNGCTSENVYIGAKIYNNVLYYVISALLKNETGSDIILPKNTSINSALNIPTKYASKIYRKNGQPCNQDWNSDGSNDILYDTLKSSSLSGATIGRHKMSLYCYTHGLLVPYCFEDITIPAGETRSIDFRVFILL